MIRVIAVDAERILCAHHARARDARRRRTEKQRGRKPLILLPDAVVGADLSRRIERQPILHRI